MRWYEITEDRRSDEQKHEAQVAYCEFLSSHPEVWCDFKRRVAERIDGCAFESELAVAQIWLESFLADTLTLAGVQGEMDILTALLPVAKSYKPESKEEALIEDHEE